MANSFLRLTGILDTDIVIDFLRGHSYAHELLHSLSQQGMAAISTMSHFEVIRGIRHGEEGSTRAFLDGLASIPVTVQIARDAGTICELLREQGVSIPIVDAIIGATAIHFDVPLVTNKVDHYPFPGLRLHRGR